jgi:hypothetical protein
MAVALLWKVQPEHMASHGQMVDWLANSFLPWAAYQALIAGRLVAVDKCPSIQLMRVGKIWWRLAAKANLLAIGREAKELYSIHQLCAGLEAGIKGGIHGIDKLWKQHKDVRRSGESAC